MNHSHKPDTHEVCTATHTTGFLIGAASILFGILLLLMLTGCQVSQDVQPGDISTTALGHGSTLIHDDGITHHALDGTPSYSLIDEAGAETFSPQPMLALALTRTGAFANSPNDLSFDSGVIQYYDAETGTLVMDMTFTNFIASASDPIEARNSLVASLVEYGVQLSADEREKYLAAIAAGSEVIGNAVDAGIRAISPVP